MASKNPGVFLLILMSSAARHHLVRDRYITVLSTCCSHCNMNTQCHRLKLSIAFRRIHPSPYSRDFRTIYVCAEMWVLGLVKASTPSPEYLFNPSTYSFCFCFVLFSIPQFNFSLCLLCMPANHPLRVKLPTLSLSVKSLSLSVSLCLCPSVCLSFSLLSLSLSPLSLKPDFFFWPWLCVTQSYELSMDGTLASRWRVCALVNKFTSVPSFSSLIGCAFCFAAVTFLINVLLKLFVGRERRLLHIYASRQVKVKTRWRFTLDKHLITIWF